MSEIKELEPKCIWRSFYALTQVPRPSGHLEKIQSFLLDWAKERHIEAFKDNAGNIVMRKAATPGMENRQTCVMQGHMDMVPQKEKTSTHNFETDPIETYIDGDWVKARGTTLGSDDGMGVATAMAILEDDTLRHGPLEALITANEETGMDGVYGLRGDTLKGDILLNFDNETEGEFVIGSAGGVNVVASLEYKDVPTDAKDAAFKLTLHGLRGGHSGLEINEGRGNANKLMVRLVRQAIADDDARLASWHGGDMRNAIPRECEVVLTIPKDNEADLRDLATYCQKLFNDEFAGIESGIAIDVEPVALPKTEVPQDIQDNLVDSIYACHDGVLRNIPSMPSIVETSSNLGIINIGDGKAEILILARSASESMKDYLTTSFECCFNMAGMKVELDGDYGAWQPNFASPIAAKMVEVYEKMFGAKPVVQVVHAGLECSIIGGTYPKMDLVSFGPTLRSPHTANERCNVPSVAKFYKFVVKLLEEIPEK
jgi:dipeptidase D